VVDPARQNAAAHKTNGLALRLAALHHPDAAIDEALSELEQLVSAVRSIAHGIHPAVLASEGVCATLGSLLDEAADATVALRVDASIGRLPRALEISGYEMIQEALANASAHGAGSARVDVRIADDALRVEVIDNAQYPAG
jgi:signal transduction histidine kinase